MMAASSRAGSATAPPTTESRFSRKPADAQRLHAEHALGGLGRRCAAGDAAAKSAATTFGPDASGTASGAESDGASSISGNARDRGLATARSTERARPKIRTKVRSDETDRLWKKIPARFYDAGLIEEVCL